MADYDRKPTSIIGRDAAADGADPIGQFARATEDAGDNASGTTPLACEDLDIIFEQEDQGVRH